MIAYIEPLKVLIYGGKALKGEEGSGFGGFCSCGGEMQQITWHSDQDIRILIAECETCWKTEAIVFRDRQFVERCEVKVFKRNELKDLLSELLSSSEYEALMAKRLGEQYNYSAFSRAKKKLEEMGFDAEELLSELIF
ncbi:hypothetical protein [Geoglobus acetivorans]|uniref:Uncharacterized protein n=1 Tax=Geoglobus acetivorans TaxID=565033 RepID=A0ABZ3H6D5_GEOAI